jgi:diguanylate cyclase (GGDEF)-like protein
VIEPQADASVSPSRARWKFSPLSIKTLLLVLGASLLTFMIATTATFLYQQRQQLGGAHAASQSLVSQNQDAISQSLWDYDDATLQAILSGMVKSGAIVEVQILDRGKVSMTARRGSAPGPVDRVWQLALRSPDGKTDIGVLKVSESYVGVREQMSGELLFLAIAELIQIVGLSALIFIIVSRSITRHLSTLASDVRELETRDADSAVSLSRGRHIPDELDELVDALNRFHRGQALEWQKRRHAETLLRERIAEIETTLGALTAGVITLDHQGAVVYANQTAHNLLGMTVGKIEGSHFQALLALIDESSGADRTGLVTAAFTSPAGHFSHGSLLLVPQGGVPFNAEISLVPVQDAGDIAVIMVFSDISAEVSHERQIGYQAVHDQLTGLGNRSQLMARLPLEIERAREANGRIAVLLVDLDNFKNVNDNLGHAVGDVLLRQLGERLMAFLKPPSWATRQGGDEFIVVVPAPGSDAEISHFVENLMTLIRMPHHIEGVELRVSCSIGISFFPEHGDDINELISRADMGMYASKKLGRNTFNVFEDHLQQQARQRLLIANALKSALQSDEFTLAYQPMIELASGRMVSAEVLLRWHSPELGDVSPAVFIPIAEETGLIVDIGEWVLREAAACALRLQAQLNQVVTLAVNVSALQFQNPRFMAVLGSLTESAPEYARLLTLEITETALVGNVDELKQKLSAIRQLGYRIAIDDFGTGYSSLSYLKHLPIDTLKIDREFVRDLHQNPQDVAIVSTIIQLGKSLNFEIVAEGLEHAEGIRILTELRCDIAQGWYYAPASPESQILSMFQKIWR